MILNREQLNEINQLILFIMDKYPSLLKLNRDIFFSDDRIREIVEDEEDIETLQFYFPGEPDAFHIEPDDFLDLADEIRTLKVVNKSFIETSLTRYYIITTNEFEGDHKLRHSNTFIQGQFFISIISEGVHSSFIVGLAAVELEECGDDWGAFSPYIAIRLQYGVDNILSEKEEYNLIQSYIFEIADTFDVSISQSEIRNPTYDYYDLYENIDGYRFEELRELEVYNEGMRLFISAVQIKDPELKFLNFYKVLEHFSPIAINIEANELMRKKLDAPKSSFENGDYIRSIFDLANSLRDKYNDEDLIKASFNTCFDFVALFEKLPESVKSTIRKTVQLKEINYSTDKQKITSAANMAARLIYKTRNRVVHAKSNFIPSGDEIEGNDFEQLNYFIKEASSQTIRWYSRQPNHYKQRIIN